jgi:flagellar biosynthesis/type III secretory pathway protein FliH
MIRRLSDAAALSEAARLPIMALPHATVVTDEADAARFGDGYREGFEAGEADGLREAEVRFAKLEAELRDHHEKAEASLLQERNRWGELTASLASAELARAAVMEKDTFEMALRALGAVLGEGMGESERLGRLVTQVIDEYRGDALCLQVAEVDLVLLPEQINGIRIEAGAGMLPGSCALMTARGRIETSIKERLDVVHRAMLKALEGMAS